MRRQGVSLRVVAIWLALPDWLLLLHWADGRLWRMAKKSERMKCRRARHVNAEKNDYRRA
jgi:hypothetical protein